MIKITVNYKENEIDQVVVKGHANYDVHGKDIVCSSVTSCVLTTIRHIDSLNKDSIKYKIEDGLVIIDYVNYDSDISKLLESMLNILKELEKEYSKNIKIIVRR